MHFSKWQGCGNDFVIFDLINGDVAVDDARFAETAPSICDRHFGVGADGVILIKRSEDAAADVAMRIFNADGSEAQMCGNGLRCLARYAYDNDISKERRFAVSTKAGIMRPFVQEGTDVSVDMGEPVLSGNKIPVAGGYGDEKVVDAALTVGGQNFTVTCVSMGNPHCVVFADKNEFVLAQAPEKIGRFFEKHEFFPEGVNVEFAEVKDASTIRMRVWERGAGITMACGTGACATLVAAALTGRTGREAQIVLDGGTLNIKWSASDNHVLMTGSAVKVYEGDYAL